MTNQATVVSKKRKGPAPTGKGAPIMVRVQPDQLIVIDDWIAKQDDTPSRPEAIRRLVTKALEKL